MLVLIDGRLVYSPTFGGVFWDVQDPPLEDIDRIEVIRGPGGTLWGANAVNGVINIITKETAQTQGPLVASSAGVNEGMQGLCVTAGGSGRQWHIGFPRRVTIGYRLWTLTERRTTTPGALRKEQRVLIGPLPRKIAIQCKRPAVRSPSQ